ncbi:putative GTP-binding protein EngB [Bienertia sinuspersici]
MTSTIYSSIGKRRQVKGTPILDKDVNYVRDEDSETDESDQGNCTKTTRTKKKKRVLRGNESLSAAIKVVKEDNEDGGTQDNWTDHDENALIEKDGEACVLGKRKTKKAYKTNTPRGLTRNLNMAKMRPGEKLKVVFNMNGQPIGDHRATLANYCGDLVKDPLNAPLYEVEQFSQIPQENKDKMWQLVLDKFDIGLDDDQEEDECKKKYMQRRKFIMESLNKKYRNFQARLKRDYYDTEETDEDRLKEENMPNFVDKKDWEWLVKYFGSEEFQYKRDKVMPGLLDVYEEAHLTSDKLPVTQMASDTLLKSVLLPHCCQLAIFFRCNL